MANKLTDFLFDSNNSPTLSDDPTPKEFMQFMASQQTQRPGALSAIGEGLKGASAPFLGQEYTNPYAAKASTGGSTSDMLNFMMMQEFLGKDGKDVPQDDGRGEFGGVLGDRGSGNTVPIDAVPPQGGMPGQGQIQPGVGGGNGLGGLLRDIPQPEGSFEHGTFADKYTGISDTQKGKLANDFALQRKARAVNSGLSAAEGEVRNQEAFEKKYQVTMGEKVGDSVRIITSLRNLMSYMKLADDKFGSTGTKLGIMGDLSKMKFVPSKWKSDYADLSGAMGQQEEVPIGALKIMSGQARYVVQLADALRKTFPTLYNVPGQRKNMAAQSARNMASLFLSIQKGYITANKLEELGIDPESDVKGDPNKQVKRLLSGIELSETDEGFLKDIEKYVLDAPTASSFKDYKTSADLSGGPGAQGTATGLSVGNVSEAQRELDEINAQLEGGI